MEDDSREVGAGRKPWARVGFAVIVVGAVLGPGVARADECDLAAAKVAVIDGVTVERRTSVAVLMSHPAFSEMSVGCPPAPGMSADVFVSWDGAYPPKAFFDTAGKVAQAAIGLKPAVVRDGAIKCQRQALQSQNELAQMIFKGVAFECHAFSRDGGGTSITIYIDTEGAIPR